MQRTDPPLLLVPGLPSAPWTGAGEGPLVRGSGEELGFVLGGSLLAAVLSHSFSQRPAGRRAGLWGEILRGVSQGGAESGGRSAGTASGHLATRGPGLLLF